MSTRSKLDARVREARRKRAALARECISVAGHMLKTFGLTHPHTQQATAIADFLGEVKRSPWRTGQRKNEIFSRIAREIAQSGPMPTPP